MRRAQKAMVGIDVGTSGVKAVAVEHAGRVVARAEEGYALSTPHPGWAEQDPEDWWRAAEAALGTVASDREVVGIGLSGQMHGLVALDSSLRVLRPAILWNDQRTQEECREIEALVGLDRLIELTGNRALPGFTAPKLLWLRRREADVFRRIAHVLLPKDYLRLRLTGEQATDASDASGTLLLDVSRRRWSDPMLNAMQLDPAWLPRVAESPEPTSSTSSVPVAAGAGDQAAGALGVGVAREGPASVVLGTSGVVFAATAGFVADPMARVHAFCHAVPGTWHTMGVMLSAGGSLRWLRDTAAQGASFEELVPEAERWPPGAEGLAFLPYLAGERTPHADPGARGALVGLSIRHDRGALVRAVLEGVAYGLRDSWELLGSLGVRPNLARASGGGARSRLWLRIVASVLEVPLEVAAPSEGAAYGAALLGGVAGGAYRSVEEAVSDCVRVSETIDPVAEWVEPYRDGYLRHRSLYPALRPLQPAA